MFKREAYILLMISFDKNGCSNSVLRKVHRYEEMVVDCRYYYIYGFNGCYFLYN
jgi:hypothetical protein